MKSFWSTVSSPLLEELREQNVLHFLSVNFALLWAKSEAEAAFLSYLWEASLWGHLCVEIREKDLFPKILCEEEELRNRYKELILQGEKESSHIGDDSSLEAFPHMPVCRWGSLYYLQRNWVYETQIIKHFQRLTENSPSSLFFEKKFNETLEEISKDLEPLQRNAIEKAKSHCLSFLLGGPGTGKTYTASALLDVFFTSKQKPLRVAVSAPTGKAAHHLKNIFVEKNKGVKVEATTLHSLLHMRKGENKLFREKHLPYDVIIIDECSMIDVRMMAYLLESISNDARLIMMGDPKQLPPIESGNVFYDLSSQKTFVTVLEKPKRFEKPILYRFAKAVQEKKLKEIQEIFAEENGVIQHSNSWLGIEKKIDRFYDLFRSDKTLDELFGALRSFRILAVMRSGPYGVDAINQRIVDSMKKRNLRYAVPILITSNDHVKQLYNGMHGILLVDSINKKEIAYFEEVDGKKGFRSFSKWHLPSFEYGFCLSVHKSQGSEFDDTLLLVPEGSEVFGREVLYTAATRAKKRLEIVGSFDTLLKTLERSSIKLSGLERRLAKKPG